MPFFKYRQLVTGNFFYLIFIQYLIIVIQCKDQVGLVAAISGALAKENINIVSMREHVDKEENRFFMRVEIEQYSGALTLEEKLQKVLPADATIKVDPNP